MPAAAHAERPKHELAASADMLAKSDNVAAVDKAKSGAAEPSTPSR